MFISSNLKVLRKRRGITQDDLATILNTKRPTLNNYENQVAVPPVEMLIKMSGYFGISIDTLVKINLDNLSEFQLRELENGNDVFVSGSRLRVLATTVGIDNLENIELVPEKAKAGYLSGFSDPEYIGSLPLFRLPFLDKEKKYRAFQISGDSMLPIPNGSYITAEFTLDWHEIKNGQPCIIFTINEGLTFKIIENNIKVNGTLRCISLNPLFPPYNINVGDIREVWKFVNFISEGLPLENIELAQLTISLASIKKDVSELKSLLSK